MRLGTYSWVPFSEDSSMVVKYLRESILNTWTQVGKYLADIILTAAGGKITFATVNLVMLLSNSGMA